MAVSVLNDAYATRRAIARVGSRAGVLDAVAGFTQRAGFAHVLLAAGPGDARRLELLMTTLPSAAVTGLDLEAGAAGDPFVAATMTAEAPVAFLDHAGGHCAIYEAVGVRDGVGLPLSGVGGLRAAACCYAATRGVPLAGREETLIAVAMMAEAAARKALSLAPDAAGHREAGPSRPQRPTQRELACLGFSSRGMSSHEIAEELRLSEHTVNTHMRSAIEKIRAKSRVQAVADALRRGWID
jgi:DNA-binding CsgD family transcriptional regulator